MAKLVSLAGLMVVVLIVVVPNHLVNGDCCGPLLCDEKNIYPLLAKCYCGDGTLATPYCGYGPCNIFGCNCDGGCRSAPGKPASSSNETNSQKKEHDRIVAYSKSNDEQLDLDEAYELAQSISNGPKYNVTVAEFTTLFEKADKDNNGKLSFDEINQLKL